MEKPYDRSIFDKIFAFDGVLEHVAEVRDDGVWPVLRTKKLLRQEIGVVPDIAWKPIHELDRMKGGPDPSKSPSLPFPFSARELAAFMLDGVGAALSEIYGNAFVDPFNDAEVARLQSALAPFDADDVMAKEALSDAFDTAVAAMKSVGRFDVEQMARALELEDRLDNSPPGEWTAEGVEKIRSAVATSRTGWTAWRKAMVRELLKVEQTTRRSIERKHFDADADQREPVAFTMKRAALISAHEQDWPTIARDIADASKNGLSAARAGAREWVEAKALQWARSKGKLIGANHPARNLEQSMNRMASLPGKKHAL